MAADKRRPGSENWDLPVSPDTRLCPLVLYSVPWHLAVSPWSSDLSLALCSVPWHSALSPCFLLGFLRKSGVSWDRHPRRARAVVPDSPVNSMPHQIAKQQQQLIQQQHKINLLQQQIQQVNMPYVMIPAFPSSHQPLPVTPDSQLALPIQPIPCKPVEYPLQLLHSPPAPVVKRPGVATHHPLQEPPQPLNLTAKPKVSELPNTSSSPSLKMNSCGPRPSSHGAPTRDLQSSPPACLWASLGKGTLSPKPSRMLGNCYTATVGPWKTPPMPHSERTSSAWTPPQPRSGWRRTVCIPWRKPC